MEFKEVWQSVTYIRNADEEIVAVQVPIDAWRALLDRIQEMEEREAARARLARLRKAQRSQAETP